MRLRMPPVGDYAGSVIYTREGVWVVSVSQYAGRDKDGYHWTDVPIQEFFRSEVLGRQVQAAELPMQVRFDGKRCLFVPTAQRKASGVIGVDGTRIKRFLNRNYPVYGPQYRPVRWTWGTQYDW